MDTIFIGADPGITGSVVLVEPRGCNVIRVNPMPIKKTPARDQNDAKKPKMKRYINRDALIEMFSAYKQLGAQSCVIERAHSMPTDSPIAAFSFGMRFESLLMASRCVGLNYCTVEPSVWRRFQKFKDKQLAVEVACSNYKGLESMLSERRFNKVQRISICESILIVDYKWRSNS